jgi:hypothetical protein
MVSNAQKLHLHYPPVKSRNIVKLALDHTNLISNYSVTKYQIIAKTGVSFPRVLWSWGETLYINFNDTHSSEITEITVYGEKEVSVNIGGNPEKVKREFLANLDRIRGLEDQKLNKMLSRVQNETSVGEHRRQGTQQSQNQWRAGAQQSRSNQRRHRNQDSQSYRNKEVQSPQRLPSGRNSAIFVIILATVFFCIFWVLLMAFTF